MTGFIPKIFDANSEPLDEIPKSFNAVKVVIDGFLRADLKWTEPRKIADQLIKKGYKIFWEIDLGIFSHLTYPLNEEVQYKALKFSLEAFQSLIWNIYESESLGLCLYRGCTDFTLDFPWSKITQAYNHHENLNRWLVEVFHDISNFNKETGFEVSGFDQINYRILLQKPIGRHLLNLFCRNICVDYLDLLCEDAPDNIPLFIMLDASLSKNPGYLAEVLSREMFKRYHLCIRQGNLPLDEIAWDDDRAQSYGFISKREIALQAFQYATVAICLPSASNFLPSAHKGLDFAIEELTKKEIHYRIIPEIFLTNEWDGLDYLLFIPEGLSELGVRKLQGFCAAGGTVITLSEKIGMPQELTFDEWTKKLLEIL